MLEPLPDDEPEFSPVFTLTIAGPAGGAAGSASEPDEENPASGRGGLRLRFVLGVTLVVAGIAASLMPHFLWQRTLAPVRAAVARASADGLAYPGVHPPAPGDVAATKTSLPAGFDASMDRLRARFDKDPHNPDVAYWLGAGFTVSGQLEKARATVDIARVHNTHEPRLWILDAILAAREGNPREARNILKRFLVSYPGNPVAEANLQALP